MANKQNSNSFYVDSTGALTDTTNKRVCGILFTANAANDTLILRDQDATGDLKLKLQTATAKESKWFRFVPSVVFPNGIYVDTITSSATATIVTTGVDS